MILTLFLMAFIAGPALFFALDRMVSRHWPLALSAFILVLASFVLRSDARLVLSFEETGAVLSVIFIWLAWVLVMALVSRALKQGFPSVRAGRLIRIACAMGTTVPWFGFAAAQMMAR
ncbi:hypothetical protein [uncultured Tateyamaria sp.]|uniref:hypothetical protein n=1 Tax=uncultured Tateyamaria sp. TaxID=455651 RepID=UPI0026200C79|nr:hypothetical protein [uncultured Tateyamaria sp.]